MTTIFGTSGNDTIYGQAATTPWSEALATTRCRASLAATPMCFNLGCGQDTIFDNGAGGEINTLQFGAAIAAAQA